MFYKILDKPLYSLIFKNLFGERHLQFQAKNLITTFNIDKPINDQCPLSYWNQPTDLQCKTIKILP